MAEFKDMLKYFREREGLSQFELSKKLGVAPLWNVVSHGPAHFHTKKDLRRGSNGGLSPRKGNAYYEAWVYL